MAIVLGNPLYVNQYGSNGAQPVNTQLNFRQMVGEVQLWNPDADPMLIGRWINNAYRKVIERRNWYGMLTPGQIITPQFTNGGTASVTTGSPNVTGNGTAWTNALIGQQFRIGFTTPWQTITAVNSATSLVLSVPFGGQSIASGYMIAQVYQTLGANVRYLLEARNQTQGWRMHCNIPQQDLNAIDTWRTSVGFAYMCANMPPTPDGQFQIEIYPSPIFAQVFPFLAYVQPANLVNDTDSPVAFIRADILVQMAIAEALIFRGKANKYYDPQTAQLKLTQAEIELQGMERNDDSMYPQDLSWDYGQGPGAAYGSLFAQNHAFSVR